jgi:hypothetical protein
MDAGGIKVNAVKKRCFDRRKPAKTPSFLKYGTGAGIIQSGSQLI